MLKEGRLNYCRGKTERLIYAVEMIYFIDPSSRKSNLELGIRRHPFRAIDDVFRELIASNVSSGVVISLKAGS